MNSYKLDDRSMDKAFLGGEVVLCKAVVVYHEPLKPAAGDRIVVMLSNGKKYMGQVLRFEYTLRRGLAEGVLAILRYPPPPPATPRDQRD